MRDYGGYIECYDLFSVFCRAHFKNRVRRDWYRWRFWLLVFNDTRTRVCSRDFEE